MPEKLTKNVDGTYKVTGPHGVHAKSSTKENAQAQVRLLNAVEHGFKPTGKQKDSPKENVQDALKGRADAIKRGKSKDTYSSGIDAAYSDKMKKLAKKHGCAGC